ncbi:hypothetical protein LLE60_22165, partial [Xanthomonas campestris]|uniref:hypothetical protein n=1 Tax=Xanthomonas campestris TaxID=339 RepID=UPI001E43333D
AIRGANDKIAGLVGKHVLADRQIRRYRRLQHRDRLIDAVEQEDAGNQKALAETSFLICNSDELGMN